mgnify:CR=1 FL=1
MTVQESIILEKHLKKSTIISNVISICIGLIVAIGVGYGFYFSTKTTLASHSLDIIEIKDDVTKLNVITNETLVFRGVSTSELNSLNSRVIKLDQTLGKVSDKIDKIIIQTK